MWRPWPYILSTAVLIVLAVLLAGCATGKSTIVQITNKISTLPAGQTYVFTGSVQHNHQQGASVSLSGAGTLIVEAAEESAIYLAPPAPPTPNSVTVTLTANGSGVSDTDTFSITAATGPVVSISPTQPAVSVSAGTPVTLTITVTQDVEGDVLTPSVNSSTNCGSVCGSFGAITGTAGSGSYTVQFYPPSSGSGSMETINVSSNLTNSTEGTAFVTINP